MMKEHDTVVLAVGLPEHGLARGDVGVVVHSYGEGQAYEVEFVTGEGKTVAVVTLEEEAIRPMQKGEILHVREVAA